MAYLTSRRHFFPENGMSLHVMRVDKVRPMSAHYHDFDELVIVSGGHGRHLTEEAVYPLVAGDVFVIRDGDAHAYQDVDGLSVINLLFDLDDLGVPVQGLAEIPGYHALFTLEPSLRDRHGHKSHLRLSPGQLRDVQRQVSVLADSLAGRAAGYRFAATAHFMELLLYLAKAYPGRPDTESADLERLGQILSYLEGHYMETITLADLCAIGHMSASTLLRHFRQGVGSTPMDYLKRLRIQHAAHELVDSTRPIGEIALDHGFSSGNYFARQFRRTMGLSPRDYRTRQAAALLQKS